MGTLLWLLFLVGGFVLFLFYFFVVVVFVFGGLFLVLGGGCGLGFSYIWLTQPGELNKNLVLISPTSPSH